MTEIWLSALTIVVLLLVLRTVNKNDNRPSSQEKKMEETLHELMADFEQENKELTRTISQIKRMVDLELTGMKEELVALRKQTEELAHKQAEVMKRMTEREHARGETLRGKVPSIPPLPSFLKDEYKEIPELYAQGMPVSDIARKLGIGNGEVEMVIQLLKKQGLPSAK